MRSHLPPALVLLAATVALAACEAPGERRDGVYDPRTSIVSCLREEGVDARTAGPVDVVADGVRIEFMSTSGAAVARTIAGDAQGAEQIGRALIWVGAAPDGLLNTIEECVDG
jgi:hypothetical protein